MRARTIACAFAVIGCAVTGLANGAPALGSRQSAFVLHPGQSKKVGRSTVVCTSGRRSRSPKRIVLAVGSQVKVDGIVVQCVSKSGSSPTQGTRAKPFPIGTAGTASGAPSSSETSWTITVKSVNANAWPAVQAANMFNDPPPPGSVDFMVNLRISFKGTGPGDTFDLTPFFGAVGSSGVSYGSVQDCGVLPSPSELDYSTLAPGAAFSLNYCWQVAQSDVASIEMLWSGGSTPGPFWALH